MGKIILAITGVAILAMMLGEPGQETQSTAYGEGMAAPFVAYTAMKVDGELFTIEDDDAAPVESAAAPTTKLVWAQDCRGRSCQMVQMLVPITDSRPAIAQASATETKKVFVSQSRRGIFGGLFRGRR
tara:strand:- start:3420 stop:3803 length:384 start_codon:yes stop_codon:yes gene_type:complete